MPTERQLFLHHLAQTSDFPLMLEIKKAKGVYMIGQDGKKYIDLISGIGVSNLGHGHPKVIKAIKKQLKKYSHLMVYGEFVQSPQVMLGQLLSKTLPAQLSTAFLVNSGSEAIEGAVKLAKRFTGKPHIVSAYNAYHGSSQGALSLSGGESFKNPFRPLLPGIQQIKYNDLQALEAVDHRVAAVVLETVQGEAGVRLPDKAYLQAVRKACDETGALMVLDEIQTGAGRTGKMWAFEHFGIVPDILVTAKGMGGGMPIGAFIASEEMMAVFKDNPVLGHISTFGGHPVSSAAAYANIKELFENKLYEQAEQKAGLFKKYLKHPKIKEIRNCGLMMAVEFESFKTLKPIIDRAIALGVLTDWFLFCDNSMRIAPPLTISDKQIKKSCDIIIEAIETAYSG